jgi:hypothetical protein
MNPGTGQISLAGNGSVLVAVDTQLSLVDCLDRYGRKQSNLQEAVSIPLSVDNRQRRIQGSSPKRAKKKSDATDDNNSLDSRGVGVLFGPPVDLTDLRDIYAPEEVEEFTVRPGGIDNLALHSTDVFQIPDRG